MDKVVKCHQLTDRIRVLRLALINKENNLKEISKNQKNINCLRKSIKNFDNSILEIGEFKFHFYLLVHIHLIK